MKVVSEHINHNREIKEGNFVVLKWERTNATTWELYIPEKYGVWRIDNYKERDKKINLIPVGNFVRDFHPIYDLDIKEINENLIFDNQLEAEKLVEEFFKYIY